MNLDTITCILLKTDMLQPFYLVSKEYNLAFKCAVSIILNRVSPILITIKSKLIKIQLVYNYRWGIRVKTIKSFRFYSRKDIQNNNLWIEGPLVLRVNEKITIQYICDNFIYVKKVNTPKDFLDILF